MIPVAVKSCVFNLVANGDLFHRPAAKRHVAVAVENEHMRCEEPPVIQSGQPVDAFRNGYEKAIQITPGKRGAGALQAVPEFACRNGLVLSMAFQVLAG